MFQLDGQISDDSLIPRMKDEYVRLLNDVMRESGYAPRLDVEPSWSISYNGNYYEFILSVYGSYIGKKNAQCVLGIDGNKTYTLPNKSGESSQGQESTLRTK